jgi:hypothetical protein
LNSSENLQFCGLDTQLADMLFQDWTRDNEQMGLGSFGYDRPVIALAREYIKGMSRAGNGNALRASDDWVEALKRQGIEESTRNRILDPNFKNIRLSRSGAEWALDTLELSWEFLDSLDERVEKIKKECEYDAEVLIGLICGVGNDQIESMKVGEEIPVLRTKSGAKGSQIVLQGPEMLPKFKAECRGFVWVSPILASKKAKYFPLRPGTPDQSTMVGVMTAQAEVLLYGLRDGLCPHSIYPESL